MHRAFSYADSSCPGPNSLCTSMDAPNTANANRSTSLLGSSNPTISSALSIFFPPLAFLASLATSALSSIHKVVPPHPDLRPRDRGPAEVRDVEPLAVEGHIRGSREQDRERVVRKQGLLPARRDPVDVVGRIARRVQVARLVQGQAVREATDVL